MATANWLACPTGQHTRPIFGPVQATNEQDAKEQFHRLYDKNGQYPDFLVWKVN